MARGGRASSDDDAEEDEEELDEPDDPGEDEPATRRPKAPRRAPPPKKRAARPIRRWDRDGTAADDEMEADDGSEAPTSAKPPRVFWRARDSLYFAPLVALAIVVILVVSMYAYTSNWPPVYVVESQSMQHGSSDVLGVINTGDLVLAQRIANASIQPYVVAQQTGYTTYGEFGDVLLYYPNGAVGTPIIHRAIIYLEWIPSVRGYTAFGLAGLPCGNATDAVYATPGTVNDCGTSDLGSTPATSTLDLYHVGWADVTVPIELNPTLLGSHSGFVTMGDNNFQGGNGAYDQSGGFQLSQLVEPGWVIGVARGMIPWVGALKLWLEGSPTAGEVPAQSWQFLGLTFAGIILLAFGLHYALRAEGVEDPRRKEAEEEEEEEYEAREGEASRARRFLRSLRPWGHDDAETDDEDGDDTPPPPKRRVVTKAKADPGTPTRRGRPRPKVRRPAKGRPASDDDDEES